MPVFEKLPKLFLEFWSKRLQIMVEMYNGRRKILNAIGRGSLDIVRQHFVKLVTGKYARAQHFRDMGLFHPEDPLGFDFLVDAKRDVV